MKKKRKYLKTPLFWCYVTGVFDRWFHRNDRKMENSAFVSKRKAAFTDYSASVMVSLENVTKRFRSDAQHLVEMLDTLKQEGDNSMGKKRKNAKVLQNRKTLIELDNSLRSEELKAHESILSYAETLKAQTTAYSHGLRAPVSSAALTDIYSVDNNPAVVEFNQAHSEVDNIIHNTVESFIN